ncbi:hypothetical protein DEU56DRAFT_397251 [Suillus clintonianus]|uniref:uncharacterized protein n=1 Tax=Suillus clintonianus TaxID=1904413 RepID=UPI001B881894|nr:uncharacterized protein DEU56DRAFT_397251 [Suillus clintonianus]KAG2135088.1 hypothetical protein DEU56DRAFT_397251 [Suillus clintonianus]
MVYYAYIKQSTTDWSYRYLAAFSSRAVADEWWRVLSTSTKYGNTMKRITPQFFTHDVGKANAASSTAAGDVAADFMNKVIFTLLYDKGDHIWSVMPTSDFTDHVSGNSFFIRSKACPDEYWYCPLRDGDHSVYTSRTERTRFRVHIIDGTPGTIMIGSDLIAITLTTVDLSVRSDPHSGGLFVSKSSEPGLKFSDFLHGFSVGSTLYKDAKSTDRKAIFKTRTGEEWELV